MRSSRPLSPPTKTGISLHQSRAEIGGRLANENPKRMELQHNAGVILTHLGDVLMASGDLQGARRRFRQGLEYFTATDALDPAHRLGEAEVAMSMGKLAETLAAEGRVDAAVLLFRQRLKIQRSLAEAHPE